MDCDSLIVYFQRRELINLSLKLQEDKDMFDIKIIYQHQLLYCSRNTVVIGKFKTELSDTIFMNELCVMRSKTFAFIKADTKMGGQEKGEKNLDFF